MKFKVCCKKCEPGTFLKIPANWEVYNYHCRKGFISIEELKGDDSYRFPVFFTTVNTSFRSRKNKNLEEMCTSAFRGIQIPLIETSFWFIYYYTYNNMALLAAEENYFAGSDHDVVEVVL